MSDDQPMPEDEVAQWRITDLALTQLDHHLLRPAPERGGALLGPRGSRLISHVIPDPRPGSTTDYRHSPRLRRRLDAVLEAAPGLRYRGTAHSHPGALAEPSSVDRTAFAAVAGANPHLSRDLLFPIGVSLLASQLDGVRERWGTAHLLDIAHGCLAGYALQDGVDPQVQPVVMRVLPVSELLDIICAATHLVSIDAGIVHQAHTGTGWLRHQLLPAGCENSVATTKEPVVVHELLVHPDFPRVPPMIATGTGPFRPSSWDLTAPLPQRIATLADALSDRST